MNRVAVSLLILSCSAGFANAAAPSLNGRYIDACVDSYLYPKETSQQCSAGAQRLAADQVCKAYGRPSARIWRVRPGDGTAFHAYYLRYQKDQNGVPKARWIPTDLSGAVFSRIACN